jgi:hypothetical protein
MVSWKIWISRWWHKSEIQASFYALVLVLMYIQQRKHMHHVRN